MTGTGGGVRSGGAGGGGGGGGGVGEAGVVGGGSCNGSTRQVTVARALVFPAASPATTANRCVPTVLTTVVGGVHGVDGAESRVQLNRAVRSSVLN